MLLLFKIIFSSTFISLILGLLAEFARNLVDNKKLSKIFRKISEFFSIIFFFSLVSLIMFSCIFILYKIWSC